MADGISIPSQFEFKELLSHTFPGFFSAISIFMVMDLWTDKDLTTWVIGGNFAGLVSFIGFVLLMGTIMGVIIDGIHHSIIEDDIFDNLKTVQEIKSVLKTRYKKICNTENTYLTRHYFYPFIGEEKKGDKAIAIDEHLEKGYYRYSEFYANIFLSLVLFSLISPFYLHQVIGFDFRHSILVGIISLSVACICLNSSYTAYRAYLRAQMSVICGFINRCATNKCSNNDNCSKNIDTEENILCIIFSAVINICVFFGVLVASIESSTRLFEYLIPYKLVSVIPVIIILLITYYILNNYIAPKEGIFYRVPRWGKIEQLKFIKNKFPGMLKDLYKIYNETGKDINLKLTETDGKVILKIVDGEYNKVLEVNKKRNIRDIFSRDVLSENALGFIISVIMAIFILMIASFISYTPPAPPIDIDPMSINLNLTNDEISKGYIETISINNTGKNPIKLYLSCNGTVEDLIEIPEKFLYNGTENNTKGTPPLMRIRHDLSV